MRAALACIVPLSLAAPAAAATVGQAAPAFTATDAAGRTVRLGDHRGRPVVLEWNNPGCPFVQKHYGSGNMQRAQALATAQGAVWLTVNSGAPGKQGHMTGPEARAFVAQARAKPTAYLLDPTGAIGRLYDARATPGMAVIDAAGRLIYQGAIDDRPTADPADIKGARNHVLAALADVKANRPVAVAQTRAYGCSVKYAS